MKSARVGDTRQGYRHGTRARTLTTSLGPATIAMPRARVHRADGTSGEWGSETVRRFQPRTARVDEAILGVYLAGGNTRRIKGALAPLLRGGPLSKDAVSRLMGRLREDFETWRASATRSTGGVADSWPIATTACSRDTDEFAKTPAGRFERLEPRLKDGLVSGRLSSRI